jgi:trans-aconitate methyltransferase
MTMTGNTWDAELYEGRFSFVWNHGTGLIELLAPQTGERILDLGCGPGQLTHQIAERGAKVIGLDGAPAMVAQARINYPDIKFILADATNFTLPDPVDAVFSNAVLHWVSRPDAALACVNRALRPGGRFVAEMGSKGNTETIMTALTAETGHTPDQVWYFPSIGEYAPRLERNGFRITHAFEFDRMTELEGENGMRDWIDMFCAPFFQSIPEPERPAAVQRVVDRLRPKLFREGQWFADYKRFRFRAEKVAA